MKRAVEPPEARAGCGPVVGGMSDPQEETESPLKRPCNSGQGGERGEGEASGSGRRGDQGGAGASDAATQATPPGPFGGPGGAPSAPGLEGTGAGEGSTSGHVAQSVKGGGERAESGEVRVRGAAAEDKGSRHSMEDTWLVLDDVAAAAEAEADWRQRGKLKAQSAALGLPFRCSFYAIFDGHGGRKAAEYARSHLLETVLASGFPRESVDVKATKKAIIEGFKRTDEGLLKESTAGKWQDGATAVCVWVLDRKVFVANIGDAKAVLARHSDPDAAPPSPSPSPSLPASTSAASPSPAGTPSRVPYAASPIGTPPAASPAAKPSPLPAPGAPAATAAAGGGAPARGAAPVPAPVSRGGGGVKGIVVTREHKALFPTERARVEKMGGSVVNGRIQGRLEVSRAFGDRLFKKAGVSAVPDVSVFGLSERERFLIIGCDGLWGVFGPTDAVEFVASLFEKGVPIESVAKRLVKEAVWERKCKDNCTAIVISFDHAT